mgnify:CR=1 FL=1
MSDLRLIVLAILGVFVGAPLFALGLLVWLLVFIIAGGIGIVAEFMHHQGVS